MYICIYVYIYVYMYIYICIYYKLIYYMKIKTRTSQSAVCLQTLWVSSRTKQTKKQSNFLRMFYEFHTQKF